MTDDAVKDAISWLESDKNDRQRELERSDADWRMEYGVKETHGERMAAFNMAIQALRQMNIKKPCEICANFKRVDCKADGLEFTAVYCPNCGNLIKAGDEHG